VGAGAGPSSPLVGGGGGRCSPLACGAGPPCSWWVLEVGCRRRWWAVVGGCNKDMGSYPSFTLFTFHYLGFVSHDSFPYLSVVVTCDNPSSSIFQTTTMYTLCQE